MKIKFDYPNKGGVIDIYPEIIDARYLGVVIIGDKKGLRYLADLLISLSEYDQESNSDSVGSRMHLHLHPNEQLGKHSCEVELCRADAKGTGEIPDFMGK